MISVIRTVKVVDDGTVKQGQAGKERLKKNSEGPIKPLKGTLEKKKEEAYKEIRGCLAVVKKEKSGRFILFRPRSLKNPGHQKRSGRISH